MRSNFSKMHKKMPVKELSFSNVRSLQQKKSFKDIFQGFCILRNTYPKLPQVKPPEYELPACKIFRSQISDNAKVRSFLNF